MIVARLKVTCKHAQMMSYSVTVSIYTHLHDSYKLHAGVSRVLKLLGLHSRRPEVVATQLCVHIHPGIDSNRMVVQLPSKNLKFWDTEQRKGGVHLSDKVSLRLG